MAPRKYWYGFRKSLQIIQKMECGGLRGIIRGHISFRTAFERGGFPLYRAAVLPGELQWPREAELLRRLYFTSAGTVRSEKIRKL